MLRGFVSRIWLKTPWGRKMTVKGTPETNRPDETLRQVVVADQAIRRGRSNLRYLRAELDAYKRMGRS